MVAMRVSGARIGRVVWKIVRGLWYLKHRTFLPDSTPHAIELQEPENRDPLNFDEYWTRVKASPSLGSYQAVFAYKYKCFEAGDLRVHGWAMLLWDRVILYCLHWDPSAARVTDSRPVDVFG
jgi:hypothetical protein